jgi:serine/threonine protein kinase/WD40 repeat protein
VSKHSAEDWSELASLVDALLDAPPERRPALIDTLSAGDARRRQQLERLLLECEREPMLFSQPAAERFASLFRDDATRFPPALAEGYRLTRELGRGGMATVYLARDVKHGRDVAVKVVHPAVAAALGTERFLQEIRIAAQLHHPHIIALYDSGDADGSLFYVMPYEAGLSLRQRLARDGPLPIDEVRSVLRDVCDALAYAHQRGIVHRDIKPDNVLLSGRRALVTDFGVATATTEATEAPGVDASLAEAGVILGTPAYMAPEQIRNDPAIDHRSDIYSAGAMAYELLAGRPPFEGATRQELLAAHLTKTPTDIATLRADIPPVLAELVMQCLEKRPAERVQTADEIVQRLDALAVTSIEAALASSAVARGGRRTLRWWIAAAASVAFAVSITLVRLQRSRPDASWRDRWANAHITRLTDFPGSEVDAAISADGNVVAFLADRDSVFDAFVTRVGSDRFANLTGGRFPQLFNEDVRNVGFSADTSQVWIRVADIASPASVSVIPTSGGPARPFLSTAVMAVWSPDGSRVAYHETTPGDPIYVADRDGRNARRILIASPGVHCHHLSWSPDGRFLYFSQGVPPDEMDIWRVVSDGSTPAERITAHNGRTAYPALLGDRTLLYTATADDGTGPWLYTMDLADRVAHRLSTGVEHYISVSASAEAAGTVRRLVATVSNPSVALWSVPLITGVSGEPMARRITLPTERSAAPRFRADSSVLYLASRGGTDAVWRLSGTTASEVWKPRDGAIAGAIAVSPDGTRMCFPVRRQGRSTLNCTNADGTEVRTVADSLDVRGAATWSPDGKWIAVTAREGLGTRIFKVAAGGGAPIRLVDSASSNPVWSPDGSYILYSGTPRARSVPLKAVTPVGQPYPLPTLTVDRVGDSYRFLPNGRQLVVKLGGFRRQDFWLFDIATGRRRQLTALRPGESLNRFDVSPDGKRIIFERARENSDIVLIELPPQQR